MGIVNSRRILPSACRWRSPEITRIMKEILETLTLSPVQIDKLMKLCSSDWGKLATLSASNANVFSALTTIPADVVPMLNTLANI